MRQRRCILWVALALWPLALGVAGIPPSPTGPASARAAECTGDECESPPPAPEDPTPGTAVVEGPTNPPAQFPKPHSKTPHDKKKHLLRRAGRRR